MITPRNGARGHPTAAKFSDPTSAVVAAAKMRLEHGRLHYRDTILGGIEPVAHLSPSS
jgi:hypothetical protein